MRHFKTKKEAQKYCDTYIGFQHSVRIFKKRKGQRGWKTERFCVGTYLDWLNWE